MKEMEFNSLAKIHFGEVLELYGFSCEKSKHCTFYKAVNDVFHIVMPDLSHDGTKFNIRVFVTSPLLEPNFERKFPDYLGIPADVCSSLHPSCGVSFRSHSYRCKLKEGFIRNFNNDIKSALTEKGIPYLNEINSIKSLLPLIKNKFHTAVATHISGDTSTALPLIEAEIARLVSLHSNAEDVMASMDFLNELIK